MEYKYILRPHHGMCIAFYQGKGYSDGFTNHMCKMIKELENSDVCISSKADVICDGCPKNVQGVCDSEEKVMDYDRKVLEYVGLSDGAVIKFKNFLDIVEKDIIAAEKREEICGDCQWNELCYK